MGSLFFAPIFWWVSVRVSVGAKLSLLEPARFEGAARLQRPPLRCFVGLLVARQQRGGVLPPAQVREVAERRVFHFRRELPAQAVIPRPRTRGSAASFSASPHHLAHVARGRGSDGVSSLGNTASVADRFRAASLAGERRYSGVPERRGVLEPDFICRGPPRHPRDAPGRRRTTGAAALPRAGARFRVLVDCSTSLSPIRPVVMKERRPRIHQKTAATVH